jgi:hypothetical protein
LIERTELVSGETCVTVFIAVRGIQRRWGRREACIGFLVGKPEGKRPLGRPRLRWLDNIRMDLQEVRCGAMDWIGLAQDRDCWPTLVNAVINIWVQ